MLLLLLLLYSAAAAAAAAAAALMLLLAMGFLLPWFMDWTCFVKHICCRFYYICLLIC